MKCCLSRRSGWRAASPGRFSLRAAVAAAAAATVVVVTGASASAAPLSAAPVSATPASAAPARAITAASAPDSDQVGALVAKAVAWLKSQQQDDGGFELAKSPGFETPDAILALAEAAQTGTTWSTAEARAAVASVTSVSSGGRSPLDAIDAFATPSLSAGEAARLVVLVAAPLGFDPAAFDPAGDGHPVDLAAIVSSGLNPDGTFAPLSAFNLTLSGAQAEKILTGSVPASTVAVIRSVQQSDGGWNYAGDATQTDVDPDTTSMAIQALIAGGVPADDPSIVKALALLAANQGADGSWKSPFDDGNPNSTAEVMMAVTAAGWDPGSSCWRDAMDPTAAGTSYATPAAYLLGAQTPDGHIAGPSDQYGVNTYGTTQAVEGLLRSWLPIAPAPAQACPAATTPTAQPPTSAPTAPESVDTETGGSYAPSATGGASAGLAASGVTTALPRTGSTEDSRDAALLGVALLALGLACVLGTRRRARGVESESLCG